MTQSPVAEPLEGITDAILDAAAFMAAASAHRDSPDEPDYLRWTIEARDALIKRLQALK